jgi:hypothetical protein
VFQLCVHYFFLTQQLQQHTAVTDVSVVWGKV